MLDEKKGTCCHKCGHVHVKGTSCPTPFLKGERSCARRSLNEAGLTDHYKDRKAERGTILDIEIPEAAYGDRNLKDVKSKLIPILQAKLDQRLSYVEGMDLGKSNNVNLGLVVYMPVIAAGEKALPIKMVCGDGSGYYYLVIAANNRLLTVYPGSKKTSKLEKDVEDHVKRERPDDVRPPKADTLTGYIYKIDIDGNEIKDVEKKPEIEKASEDTLDYKVRTDYRVGATFDHKQFGPGKIVAADKGGKAGPDGKIDWIDVKYAKPFMKGGKLQDIRRFNNILTSAYFGKTLKEASEEVKCKECGWHWKLKDGGKDPYICHKCGHDNTPTQTEMHTMKHDGHDEHHQLRADVEETDNYCPTCLAEYITERWNKIEEAEYRGRKVSLGKPFLTPGGPKKRSVYVKNAKGNVVKVNFGDPNMRIKKSNPKRRKSYRARHHCQNPGPRWKANYWSCRAW